MRRNISEKEFQDGGQWYNRGKSDSLHTGQVQLNVLGLLHNVGEGTGGKMYQTSQR